MVKNSGSVERTVAKALLEIEAVYFTSDKQFLSSRCNSLPSYCDNPIILSYPRLRDIIIKSLKDEFLKEFPDCEMIMGTAPAGISFASFLSKELNLPMGYVLSEKKRHAFQNRVEGALEKGMKVVIIDDMIVTGKRVIETKEVLEKENLNVLGTLCVTLYDYKETINNLKKNSLKYVNLTKISFIAGLAMEVGKIKYDDYLRVVKKLGGDINALSN